MEVWTSKVSFAHEANGRIRTIPVKGMFPDNTPIIEIDDELIELASTRLYDADDDVWDFIESDLEEES